MANVAFLGLGNMGGPMAKNLIAAGHTLTVFDLVAEACAALATEGASVATSALGRVRCRRHHQYVAGRKACREYVFG